MLNLGAIALWALSRTAGAPFGPHAGEAELVQAADLCALLLQIYVVMGASWVWYRGLQGEPVPVFGSALVLMGAVGVVALASTVGVASGLQHGHAPASADGGHHGTTPEDGRGEHHGTTPEDAQSDHHGAGTEPEEGNDHGTTGEHAHSPESNHEPAAPPPVNEPAGESAAPAPAEVPATAQVPATAEVPAPPAVLLHDDHGDHDHGE